MTQALGVRIIPSADGSDKYMTIYWNSLYNTTWRFEKVKFHTELWEPTELMTICPDEYVKKDMQDFCRELVLKHELMFDACQNENQEGYKESSRELAESFIALKMVVNLRCAQTQMAVQFVRWLDKLMLELKELASQLECPLS
jgi:hypothetical protein